ncbi:MAG: protein kinase [Lachnospiraceae bacterium]|nr:protein kinase [Lachnospiraceae bacterium]
MKKRLICGTVKALAKRWEVLNLMTALTKDTRFRKAVAGLKKEEEPEILQTTGNANSPLAQEFLKTYEPVGTIRQGNETLFKAWHKEYKIEVVLKRISLPPGGNPQIKKTMLTLKELSCPWLPNVFDFFETPAGSYAVMEYIPGKTLRELLDEGKQFTQEECDRFSLRLFDALGYLHSQDPKIIHGNISLDNLVVTETGALVIVNYDLEAILLGTQTADALTDMRAAEAALRELRETGIPKEEDETEPEQQRKLVLSSVIWLIILVFVLGMTGVLMGVMKRASYRNMVSRMEEMNVEYAENGSETDGTDRQMESLYEKCLKIDNKKLDARFQYARFLYLSGSYDSAIILINDELLADPEALPEELAASLYSLLGHCYLERTPADPEKAAVAFKNAAETQELSPYYAYLTISLLESDELQIARSVLQGAASQGLKGEELELARGWLSVSLGDYEEAMSAFRGSLSSDDPAVRQQAWLEMRKALLIQEKSPENYEQSIALMEEAMASLPERLQKSILQKEAEDSFELYKLTEDPANAQAAIALFYRLLDKGWEDGYKTYMQLGILEEAAEIL